MLETEEGEEGGHGGGGGGGGCQDKNKNIWVKKRDK